MNDALFEPKDLPKLADPDPIAVALFESPMLAGLGLIVLGILAFATLRSAGKPMIGIWTLIACSLACASVFATASLITTDRESIVIAAGSLVEGVGSGDRALLETTLHQDARLRSPFSSADGRDPIVQLSLNRAAPRTNAHSIKDVDVEIMSERTARSMIRVRVEISNQPNRSVWQVDWIRDDIDSSVWVATFIRPLWIQGIGRMPE